MAKPNQTEDAQVTQEFENHLIAEKLSKFASFVQGCKSDNEDIQIISWGEIDTLLKSTKINEEHEKMMCDMLVEHDIISCLIQFLSKNDCTSNYNQALTRQVMLCLTNVTAYITNDSHLYPIIQCKPALHKIINLTMSQDEEIADCALWTMANILNADCGDSLLKEKVPYPIPIANINDVDHDNYNGKMDCAKEGTLLDRLVWLVSKCIAKLNPIASYNYSYFMGIDEYLASVKLLRRISWIFFLIVFE